MNTDIRLSVGFWQHPKTKKTARRLGLEGVRSLQVLWLWAAQNRSDGTLSGMDWEDIELAADWQGEERKFFDTCLGMWIDETDEGYSLHDWQDHNPWQAEAQARSEKSQKAAQARWNKAKENNAQCSSDAQALHEHDSSNAPLLSFPEEKKEECVFNAGVRVKASSVPEKALEQAPEPVAEKPKAFSPRQPSLAFDQFFDAYQVAHRGGRAEAERVWVGLEHNHSLPGLNRLLDALGEWEASERWKAKGGQYIPTAANFLAREYWLQKPPTPEQNKPAARDGPVFLSAAERKAQRLAQDGEESFLARMRAREILNGNAATYGLGTGGIVHALSATLPGQAGA